MQERDTRKQMQRYARKAVSKMVVTSNAKVVRVGRASEKLKIKPTLSMARRWGSKQRDNVLRFQRRSR